MRRPCICAVAVALVLAPGALGSVWYVDAAAPPGGDGASWGSAWRYLQDALLSPDLAFGDQVHVAQGVYRPDQDSAHPQGTIDPEATFDLIHGVAVYGGFPPGGGPFSARKPAAYPTILDGNMFEPPGDVPSCAEPGADTGNCFESTPGTAACDEGACCSSVCDSLPLCCLLEWNDLCVEAAVELCRRVYHLAYAYGVQSVRLDGFTIRNSRAVGPGFWDQNGGGLIVRYAAPVVAACTFTRNIAQLGGAVYAYGFQADPRLINCTFVDNDALQGGAINAEFGAPRVVNSLFYGNVAFAGHGGAIYVTLSSPAVYNSTFSGNAAFDTGGATFGVPTMANCIAWDNAPDQIVGGSFVAFSCVQGGHPGPGNLSSDPAFEDAAGGNFHLLAGSPCIDHGGNSLVPNDAADLDADLVFLEPTPFDRDLNLRIANAVVDIGAFERCRLDADLDGSGSVGIVNLLQLLIAWGSGPGVPADLDGNGTVGVTDLLLLLAAWGPCAAPP